MTKRSWHIASLAVLVLVLLLTVSPTAAMSSSSSSSSKKSKKIAPTGYVYMNVLGPYSDDGLFVVKVGKAGVERLGARMLEEYNAADAMSLSVDWPWNSGKGDAEGNSFAVYEASFDPKQAGDALPYLMANGDLDDFEDDVREAWCDADKAFPLDADASREWLATHSLRVPKEVRGDAKVLGATTECVVVPVGIIDRVRAAGRATRGDPAKWNLDALQKAIASRKRQRATALKDEWAVNDVHRAVSAVVKEHAQTYFDAVRSVPDLDQSEADQLLALLDKQQKEMLALIDKLKTKK